MASHWISAVVAGSTTTTGTAIPQTSLSIPPQKRLARVIVNHVCQGVQINTSSALNIGQVYFNPTLYLEGGSYGTRVLHKSMRILHLTTTAIFDSTQAVGSRQIFHGYHGGGDREVGIDTQVSYGDIAHNAGTLRLTGGYFVLGTSKTNFVVTRTIEIRALYFDP